jgi:hypothetical protein
MTCKTLKSIILVLFIEKIVARETAKSFDATCIYIYMGREMIASEFSLDI